METEASSYSCDRGDLSDEVDIVVLCRESFQLCELIDNEYQMSERLILRLIPDLLFFLGSHFGLALAFELVIYRFDV